MLEVSLKGDLPRKWTITKKDHFSYIYEQGSRMFFPFCVLFYAPSYCVTSRYSFVASRKVGRAFERNRAKRLLREFHRLHRFFLSSELDYIWIAKRGIVGLDFLDVQEMLVSRLVSRGLLFL